MLCFSDALYISLHIKGSDIGMAFAVELAV